MKIPDLRQGECDFHNFLQIVYLFISLGLHK